MRKRLRVIVLFRVTQTFSLAAFKSSHLRRLFFILAKTWLSIGTWFAFELIAYIFSSSAPFQPDPLTKTPSFLNLWACREVGLDDQSRISHDLFSVFFLNLSDAALCQRVWNSEQCVNAEVRYYFDSTAKQCKSFKFANCLGNENMFPTEAECQARCTGLLSHRCVPRVVVQNLSYENEFDFPVYDLVGGTNFHMNCFARRLVLTLR